jgi:hypothetical protein
MAEIERPRFHAAAFWRGPDWGEESSNWLRKKPSFRSDIPSPITQTIVHLLGQSKALVGREL